MNLEIEAKEFLRKKNMSNITATEYQRKAKETAIFPADKALEYLSLGLVGEAGEVANKVKKLIRDKKVLYDTTVISSPVLMNSTFPIGTVNSPKFSGNFSLIRYPLRDSIMIAG